MFGSYETNPICLYHLSNNNHPEFRINRSENRLIPMAHDLEGENYAAFVKLCGSPIL